MGSETVLGRVAAAHCALVALLAVAAAVVGLPLKGLLLGGSAMALALVSLWTIFGSLVGRQRRALGYALGTLKILLYFGLTTAALTGRFVVDPLGFAAGVSCFVVAATAVVLSRQRVAEVA
jgi:hypothetical protein